MSSKVGMSVKSAGGQMKLVDKTSVIRPWSNNARIGCYWLPRDKDTVEIKATVDYVGLL